MTAYIVFYTDFDGEPQMAKGFSDKEKALEFVYKQNLNTSFGWHYEEVEVE